MTTLNKDAVTIAYILSTTDVEVRGILLKKVSKLLERSQQNFTAKIIEVASDTYDTNYSGN